MRKSLELRLYEAVHRYAEDHGLTADEFSLQAAAGHSNVMRWSLNADRVKFEFLHMDKS